MRASTTSRRCAGRKRRSGTTSRHRTGWTCPMTRLCASDSTVPMSAPLPEAWDLFDACAGLPLLLLHGENSDVLSRATADEMQARRPDLIRAELPGRGHVPFLDEPDALAAIHRWLDLCRTN
ncbi:alpha/beta fold hydrolase [Paracoccus versutus]|nr:alpha/beta hydrolase [Paracoccus versutus]